MRQAGSRRRRRRLVRGRRRRLFGAGGGQGAGRGDAPRRSSPPADRTPVPAVIEEGTISGSASPQPRYEDLQDARAVQVSAEMLERAVTHRSDAYENGGLPTNERLECIGDSVRGLVVTDALYTTLPDLPEGQLAKLRASVVNMKARAGVARGLGIGGYLRLGKGEGTTGGRDKASILADTPGAPIGAGHPRRRL